MGANAFIFLVIILSNLVGTGWTYAHMEKDHHSTSKDILNMCELLKEAQGKDASKMDAHMQCKVQQATLAMTELKRQLKILIWTTQPSSSKRQTYKNSTTDWRSTFDRRTRTFYRANNCTRDLPTYRTLPCRTHGIRAAPTAIGTTPLRRDESRTNPNESRLEQTPFALPCRRCRPARLYVHPSTSGTPSDSRRVS